MLCFKTNRQAVEYETLKVKNKNLVRILDCLVTFCELEFKKDITLTDIFRTQADFDALYAATPVDKRPKSSPHMVWEAVDIRSSTFSDPEIIKMQAFLNQFTAYKGSRKVALYHKIAAGAFHFHVQKEI